MNFIKCLTISLSVIANIAFAFEPLRDVKDLKVKGKWEKSYRVKTAKVVWLDYDLIRKDFQKEVAGLSDAQINSWMLDQVAYISETQIKYGEKNGVNSKIVYDPNDFKKAYRPPTYGRAYVYQTGTGLIDAKGSGAMPARIPENDGHGTGLAPLGEMVREVIMSRTVSEVFEREGGVHDVVASYGVIDWGFDLTFSTAEVVEKGVDQILDEANEMADNLDNPRLIKEIEKAKERIKYPKIKVPAGMVLRQAHDRIPSGGGAGYANGQIGKTGSKSIEMTLAKYGLTSGSAWQVDGDPMFGDFSVSNIQGVRDGLKAKNGAIVDFGTITAMNENHRALYGYIDLDDMDEAAKKSDVKPIISHKQLIQPDPKVRVPFRTFGRVYPWRYQDFMDNPRLLSDWLIFKWRKGLASSKDVDRLYAHLMNPLRRRWARADGKGFFASGCWRDVMAKAAFIVPVASAPFVYKKFQQDKNSVDKDLVIKDVSEVEPVGFKVSGDN